MAHSGSKYELEPCSSLCSCPLLMQLHENFVRKFKVYPNNTCVQMLEMKDIKIDRHRDNNVMNGDDNDDDPEILDELRNIERTVACVSGEMDDGLMAVNIDYEIIDQESRTPIPIYEMMSETELNAELAKFGHAPMGKRAAIRLLNQIFEATHPAVSENTPLSRKIAKSFISNKPIKEGSMQARQKRTKDKIHQLIEKSKNYQNEDEDIVRQIEVQNENQQMQSDKEGMPLKQIFLIWLRKPENEQMYADLLLLNPIFTDKIYASFRHDSSDAKMSKEAFVEMLDDLGITHCSRNDPIEND